MQWQTVRTRPFLPPKDDIYGLFDQHLPPLQEGDVLFITSKIVGIHEGRCLKISDTVSKDELILQEAERYIPRKEVPNEYVLLTIKNHTIISSAGIDKSNANGYYVLWPKDPSRSAREICQYLKEKYRLKNLGVIITDSCSLPLRAGTIGIAIGLYGFHPLKNYVGQPDIFGRPLEVTRSNIADCLASMAVLLMGEADEQTPLVLLRDFGGVRFTDQETRSEHLIPWEDDMYYPLLKVFKEVKK